MKVTTIEEIMAASSGFWELETPIYLLNLYQVEDNINQIKNSITYPNFQIHYAMFCNDNEYLLGFLRRRGIGVLALNRNEIEIASRAKFPDKQVHVTGGTFNNKELSEMLNRDLDVNLSSLRQLDWQIGGSLSPKVNIRIKLTGDEQVGSGEGIPLQDVDEVLRWADGRTINGCKARVHGLQTYLGTNILNEQRYIDAIKTLIQLREKFPDIKYINIGGGFGIPYSASDKSFNWERFGREASKLFSEMNAPDIQFKMEPGRSIVGNAGYFLTRVIERRDDETLVVDASYTNFARPFVYSANHRVQYLRRKKQDGIEKKVFDIRGCSINSRDFLSYKDYSGDKAELPLDITEGDILCFRDAGAYSPVMQMDFLHYDKARTMVIEPISEMPLQVL